MTSFDRVYTKILSVLQTDENKTTNIIAEQKNPCFYIKLNRPKRFNAFSTDMYVYMKELILKANQTPEVKYIIISGAGGNFSSGNDLKNFIDPRLNDFEGEEKVQAVITMASVLKELTQALIESEKPIYGIVEGNVVGFAFTQLALYDRVFAVKGAEFTAPLVKLAQGPQMCASYLFPRRFGKKMASELIMEGKKVGPDLLQKYGFLQTYSSKTEAENALKQHLTLMDGLDWKSVIEARKLMNAEERAHLTEVNNAQIKNLIQRWLNPNLVEFLMNYLQNAKKNTNK